MGIFLLSLSLASVVFIVTPHGTGQVSAGPLAEELRDSANYTHVRAKHSSLKKERKCNAFETIHKKFLSSLNVWRRSKFHFERRNLTDCERSSVRSRVAFKRHTREQSVHNAWNDPQPGVVRESYPWTAMCVRNVDVHVSCSSQVDAQLAAFFIDPRAKWSTVQGNHFIIEL